ncbi:hypothetical protein CIHG_09545 [Coccidioides immitis H538.4]|uniref:Uncharacterized protein n=1 Tax=Coccidioides immitis H538.4 TaxID=396776 RepID=A0A0J8UV62_COCIT|nr:hypothetical protein CIHG_09545 [Coccidioides immitis H538.4]
MEDQQAGNLPLVPCSVSRRGERKKAASRLHKPYELHAKQTLTATIEQAACGAMSNEIPALRVVHEILFSLTTPGTVLQPVPPLDIFRLHLDELFALVCYPALFIRPKTNSTLFALGSRISTPIWLGNRFCHVIFMASPALGNEVEALHMHTEVGEKVANLIWGYPAGPLQTAHPNQSPSTRYAIPTSSVVLTCGCLQIGVRVTTCF